MALATGQESNTDCRCCDLNPVNGNKDRTDFETAAVDVQVCFRTLQHLCSIIYLVDVA